MQINSPLSITSGFASDPVRPWPMEEGRLTLISLRLVPDARGGSTPAEKRSRRSFTVDLAGSSRTAGGGHRDRFPGAAPGSAGWDPASRAWSVSRRTRGLRRQQAGLHPAVPTTAACPCRSPRRGPGEMQDVRTLAHAHLLRGRRGGTSWHALQPVTQHLRAAFVSCLSRAWSSAPTPWSL